MKMILGLVAVIIVVAAGWYLASPLFFDKTVDEVLPFAGISQEDYDDMQEAAEGVKLELPSYDEMKKMTAEEKTALDEEMTKAAQQMEDIEVKDEKPADEPVAVLRGSFSDADGFHKGSGEATVYKLPDGSQLLRFEDFEVTNGPDLRVLLAVDGNPSQSIELGKLKGNIGDQNYQIPADTETAGYNSVIIYCKPFHVIFSTATFSQP